MALLCDSQRMHMKRGAAAPRYAAVAPALRAPPAAARVCRSSRLLRSGVRDAGRHPSLLQRGPVRVRVATVEPPPQTEAKEAGEVQADKGYADAVVFQGFGWDSSNKGGWYNIVKSNVDELKKAGCSHLWLPPPTASVAPQGYMPTQWYKLDSKYGSKQELKTLNQALLKAGITPLADIVVNHRSAEKKVDGKYSDFQDLVSHDGERIDWDQRAIAQTDDEYGGQGHPDTGEDFWAAPDLDHLNPKVQSAIVEWLNWMKEEVAFGGWRFDFVKGYGPEFVGKYVGETVGAEVLNIGELWVDMNWGDNGLEYDQNGTRQALCNWVDGNGKRCTAFDFATKGILQEACKNTEYWRLRDQEGKPTGMIGWWPGKAVTFIDNHDTGSSQAHWPFPGDKVATGYAYIMTHPGVPCVFWEHFFDWGEDMKKNILALIELRKRNNLNSESRVKILAADADLYFAIVDDRVALKLGPRYDIGGLVPKPEEGWNIALSGKDFAIWEKQ